MECNECGIEAINLYTSHYYLPLSTLARERGIDEEKFLYGIGQRQMGISPPTEDSVTLGANAAFPLLKDVDVDAIDTVIFATESSVDQSKSGANFVHKMLGLPSHCRTIEVKQACYASTGAVCFGMSLIKSGGARMVLVIASDIARYRLNTPEEPTQGCGAIAMVLSSNPKIATVAIPGGTFSEDVYDFWRPNYREEALVNKTSIKCYLTALENSWKRYSSMENVTFGDFSYFCFHQPFVKMVEKAYLRLCKINDIDDWRERYDRYVLPSTSYTAIIGNSYTASLYIGLLSLLDKCAEDHLSGQMVGLFSYGSGCMSEFFSCKISRGYKPFLQSDLREKLLSSRKEISYEEYENLYHSRKLCNGKSAVMDDFCNYECGKFFLSEIREEQRIYLAR